MSLEIEQEYASLMYETLKADRVELTAEFFTPNNPAGYAVYQYKVAVEVLNRWDYSDSELNIDHLIEEGDDVFSEFFVDEEFGVNALDGCGELLDCYKY